MDALVTDLRHALRALVARPGFTLMVVIPLALGIGMNTAIFSAVYAVLLRSLPYDSPERLVRVWEARPRMGPDAAQIAAFEQEHFREWRRENTVFEGMAAYGDVSFNLTGGSEAVRIEGQSVSPALFTLLGVEPALGRTFAPEEETPGNGRVVVLSHDLWTRQFGADPTIVERTIQLDGNAYDVVGVMPAAFGFPDPEAELWVPQVMAPAAAATPGEMRIELVPVIAKLKPGVSAESAEAAAETFLNNLRGTSEMAARMNEGITIHLTSLHEQLVAPVRPQLLVLTAAVGLVLLIACANVANLFLARARGRERDHAVRAALGAGRARLVTRLLMESAAFGLAGGALGAVVAYWGIRLLRFLQPPDLPLLEGAGLSVDVLLFNLAIALVTAALVGLIPAIRSSRVDLVTSLKGLGVSGGSGGSPHRARNALAIAEVALALVLFVAAGLMLKSFSTLTSIDPGYQPADVWTFRLNLPETQYATGADRRAVYDRLRDEVGAMPGVRSVGVANVLPLDGARFITSIHVEGRPQPEDRMNAPRAEMRVVSPGFFRAMGIQLSAGTGFDEGDGPGTPGKVLINEALRARYFENEDPIGKRLTRMGEIVGVVADVRHEGFDAEPGPEVYLDYRQLPEPMAAMLLGSMSVAARVDPGQAGVADGLRSRLRAIDPELPLSDLRPMEARLADSVARPRLYAVLLALFAALALLLATSGVYSVVSYMVSQRTRETGVRLAFGASPTDIVRHVLGDGVRILAMGVGLGLAATLLLARYLRSVLYEVEPLDPVTIGAVALLLGACVLAASALPARRAARTDAMKALRYE